MVIGIVALIVVGPKDLPVMFRNVGRFVGKAKGMAREFTRAMNDAADDAGVNDLSKTLKAATNPIGSAMDSVKDATKGMTDIKPSGSDSKLSAEREEQRKKIEANTARMAADRKKREAEEAAKKADDMEASLSAAPDATPDTSKTDKDDA